MSVVDYINRWCNEIYDSKSQRFTNTYIDFLLNHHGIIIDPDNFIFEIITKIITTCMEQDFMYRSDQDKIHRKLLCDYLANKTNNYHIYFDANNDYKYFSSSTNYYLGNEHHSDKYTIVPDHNVEFMINYILLSRIIVKPPINPYQLYGSDVLQFLPNCIRDIIHQYLQDIVYIFIKMMLDSKNNIDEVIEGCDITSQYNMKYYLDISYYCVYIMTDWILLLSPKRKNNIFVHVNINENDYMYGLIQISYIVKVNINYKKCNYSFIHCSDMIDLYNDFIKNYESESYKELKDIPKTMKSFINNIHSCTYVYNRLISKGANF